MKNFSKQFFRGLKKFSIYSSVIIGIPSAYTFYNFQELRNHPILILQGVQRYYRAGVCTLKMAIIYKNPFSKLTIEERHKKAGAILCKVLKKNGGTSVKTGQALAMMEVLLPDEFTDQLTSLFQQADISKFEDIKSDIEKSLGKPFNEIFSSFNETPIASGSIAQVYKAVLKNTNKEVAVKVRHPLLKESIEFDLAVFGFFIEVGSFIDKNFNFRWIYDDASQNLRKETNFVIEADNIEKITKLMKNTKGIGFPKVLRDISNDQILVMEFINGYSITDVERLKKDKISLDLLAKIMAESFAKMVFEIGFVHADPHPGNVFIQKTSKNDFKVILLDNGLYADLSEKTRDNYAAMWKGIITRNEDLLKQSTNNLGVGFAFKLFVSMVTSQTYANAVESTSSDVKERIKGDRGIDEKRRQNAYMAKKWRKEILECLEKMNRDMILLFKINNYIESIDNKLGQPINNYWYTTKYSFANYMRHNNSGFLTKIKTRLQLLSVLFWLKIYEWSLRIRNW